MEKFTRYAILCLVIGSSFNSLRGQENPQRVLRHVVVFQFKADTGEAKIGEIVNAFGALQSQIPEIKGFEWGTNNSPEGLNKGLTHCFTLTFHSEADRDAYLPHPAHKAFGEIAGPHIADVFVVDYWAQSAP